MAGRLAGKTALITGAAQGIGRASAELFAAEGARVIATDLQPGACADVAGCEPRPLDVTDGPAVRALADALGPIDVLFNCAGWVHAGTILDCDDDAWDRSFTINAKAMFLTIKAFLPGMIARGGGSIVNSRRSPRACGPCRTASPTPPARRPSSGSPSRWRRLHGKGIRCNAICPGTVESPSSRSIQAGPIAPAAPSKRCRRRSRHASRLGLLARPQEIANLALYLASDESSFTTARYT